LTILVKSMVFVPVLILLAGVASLCFNTWAGPSWIGYDPNGCEDDPTVCFTEINDQVQIWTVYYGCTRDTQENFLGYRACHIGEEGVLVMDLGGLVTDKVPNSPDEYPTFHDDWPSITTDGQRLWVFHRHIDKPDKRTYQYSLAYKTALPGDLGGGMDNCDGWSGEIKVPTPTDLARVGTPSATYVPGDSANQIWVAFYGRLETGGRGKKASYNNDIYVIKGTINPTIDPTSPDAIIWGEGERITSAPESEAAPTILYTGNTDNPVILVYESDNSDETHLYAKSWTGQDWSVAEKVTNYGSTDYMMYPSLGFDPGGKVWLFYEARFPFISAKYLENGGWSNRILISDYVDELGVPVPLFYDGDVSDYTYIVVRGYEEGNHIAYLQWKGSGYGPTAPGSEVYITLAEYNNNKGILSVEADCTTQTTLYVYGQEEDSDQYIYLGCTTVGNPFDEAIGISPKYVLVSTEITDPYEPSCTAGFDISRVIYTGRPRGAGKKN